MNLTPADRADCAQAATRLLRQSLLPTLSLALPAGTLLLAPADSPWRFLPLMLTLLMLVQIGHLLLDAAVFSRFAAGTLEPERFDARLATIGLARRSSDLRPIADRIAGAERVARRARVGAAISSVLSLILLIGWWHV